MTSWPLLPYLVAGGLCWAWCHWVVPGWRQVKAQRRNHLYALRRIHERSVR